MDINHRRKNRKPVNQRYAFHEYNNGYGSYHKKEKPETRGGKTDYLDKSMHGWGNYSALADATFGGCIGNDFTNGHRGMARAVRGAKKFARTRTRFHENAATRKLAQEA